MTSPPTGNTVRTRQRLRFAVIQLVLLSLLTGSSVLAIKDAGGPEFRLPQFERLPLEVRPQYNDPRIVTDSQLQQVLLRLQPVLGETQQKINHVDHALRFWRTSARFSNPDALSGNRMLQLLTDDSALVESWGLDCPPLLMPKDTGIAVRTQQGYSTSSHVDHTLASLAEIGTPLDHEIIYRSGRGHVADLLRHALRGFRVNQAEYEWTTLSLALYASSAESWTSIEGQRVDFNLLARRLMRQRFGQGVCEGNHRLYTLAILLRVDDARDILTSSTRDAVINHLVDATRRLVTTQNPAGFWDAGWSADETVSADRSQSEIRRARILATGHALEWWAMSPESVHPSRELIVRAGQWLVNKIASMSDESIRGDYTFLTHAGRALTLWRAQFPDEFMRTTISPTEYQQ